MIKPGENDNQTSKCVRFISSRLLCYKILERLTRCGDTGTKQNQAKNNSTSLASSVKRHQGVSKARNYFLTSANKTSRSSSNRSSSRNQSKEKRSK